MAYSSSHFITQCSLLQFTLTTKRFFFLLTKYFEELEDINNLGQDISLMQTIITIDQK